MKTCKLKEPQMTFLEVKAPMTAKCIIRDAARKWGLSERQAELLVAECVAEIRAEGYEIVRRT